LGDRPIALPVPAHEELAARGGHASVCGGVVVVVVGRERQGMRRRFVGEESTGATRTHSYRVCTSWIRFLRLAVLKLMVLEEEDSVREVAWWGSMEGIRSCVGVCCRLTSRSETGSRP
jgi:hypothetical protein